MDSATVTINITGTHDGTSYNESGTFTASVRSLTKFSRDVSNSFASVSVPSEAFVFAIVENRGDEDAFVFFGRLTCVLPAGKAIVISGSTAEDVSGTKAYAAAVGLYVSSRTSAGTRITGVIGY